MILGSHKREMLFIDDIHLVTKIKKNMITSKSLPVWIT